MCDTPERKEQDAHSRRRHSSRGLGVRRLLPRQRLRAGRVVPIGEIGGQNTFAEILVLNYEMSLYDL